MEENHVRIDVLSQLKCSCYCSLLYFCLTSVMASWNPNPTHDPLNPKCPKSVTNPSLAGQIGCTKEQKSPCLPLPHLALLSLTICGSAWSQSVSRVLLLLLVSFQTRGNPSNSLVHLFWSYLSSICSLPPHPPPWSEAKLSRPRSSTLPPVWHITWTRMCFSVSTAV